VDHTYVTSSCGLLWGCWGRNSGGQSIRGSIGNSIIADCLSQPNSQAGIVYGITGVCHQTANRILHPAATTVAGCNGYVQSAFVYGAYGRRNWTELSKCYPVGTAIARNSGGSKSQQGDDMTGKDTYDQAVSGPKVTAENGETSRLNELAALVEMALGRPLDAPTFQALAIAQSELWKSQENLETMLQRGDVHPEDYLKRLNSAIEHSMQLSLRVLGRERFDAIFGEAGRHPEDLVDRAIFSSQARPR
jgi:hypothetical protein